MPDLSSPKWHERHDDEAIRSAIRRGVPDTKMEAYGHKMTPAQLESLVQYVRGLKK